MSLSLKESLNLTRYRPNRANYFETYYIMWNDLEQGHAGWVRYTLYRSSKERSEAAVWGIFIDHKHPERNVAIKDVLPFEAASFDTERFRLDIGRSGMTQEAAWGEVASGDQRMSWRLTTAEEGPDLQHFPPLLYRTPVPTTKFLAPSGWYGVGGTVTVNGQTIEIRNARAQQAHFWGTKQVEAWTWGNCALFKEDPDFAFEGVVGYLKRGLPPMAMFLFRFEGKTYACNSLLQCFVTNKSRHTMDGWTFEARHGELRFKGQMRSTPAQMVLYKHVDPDGQARYSHNDLNASLTIEVQSKQAGRWETFKTFTADRAAKFEVAQPEHDPRVTTVVEPARPATVSSH